MKQNKSHCPDGFNVNFFLHTWDVIGEDFTKAVKLFFAIGCMLRETNAIVLVLVPKGPNSSSMNDYKPISCCNTTYKCISKIIVTRLKPMFPYLISNAQFAFVPCRRIGDNILIAQELFRGYNIKTSPSRCAFKIDLRKAFDTVPWDFLFKAFNLFKISPLFINWIEHVFLLLCSQ